MVHVLPLLATIVAQYCILPDVPKVTRSVVIHSGIDGSFGRYAMAPAMLRLPDNRILLAYSRGDTHTEAQDIRFRHSDDEGRSWSAERTFPFSGPYPERGVALTNYGPEILMSWRVDSIPVIQPNRTVHIAASSDGGLTWSVRCSDCLAGLGSNSANNGPSLFPVSPGILGMGVYWRNIGGPHGAGMVVSTDAGATWSLRGTIATSSDPAKYSETSIVRLLDGRLVAMVRSDATRDILMSYSGDDGRTWSTPDYAVKGWNWPSTLVHNCGMLLVLTRNATAPYGGIGYVSWDGGATWRRSFPYGLTGLSGYGMQVGAHAITGLYDDIYIVHAQEHSRGTRLVFEVHDRWNRP